MKFIQREATRESEEEENGKTEIHERTVRSAFCPESCVFSPFSGLFGAPLW